MGIKNDFDFRDYIALEQPEAVKQTLVALGLPEDMSSLPGTLKSQVEKALEEISSTPEGENLIRMAAGNTETGIIQFVYGSKSEPQMGPGAIGLGEGYNGRYMSPETRGMQDASLQNVLVHELYHFVDERPVDVEHAQEREDFAVEQTNSFMKKYYAEPERGAYILTDPLGTPTWDFNPNFRPEGYPDTPSEQLRLKLLALSEDYTDQLSPELQSLYENREDTTRFTEQFDQLENSIGGIIVMTEFESAFGPVSVIADPIELKAILSAPSPAPAP